MRFISFSEFLQLFNIIAWPGVALLAAFFFRRVFTYMFFSMDQFNFFGAHGRLRRAEEMIEEEAARLVQREKDAADARAMKEKLADLEAQLAQGKKQLPFAQIKTIAQDAIELAGGLLEENKLLKSESFKKNRTVHIELDRSTFNEAQDSTDSNKDK